MYDRFFDKTPPPQLTSDLIANAFEGNDGPLRDDADMRDILSKYVDFKKKARDGDLGKNPQFWVKYYLDVIQILHSFYIAVQESN